jgi:hypothetical protein
MQGEKHDEENGNVGAELCIRAAIHPPPKMKTLSSLTRLIETFAFISSTLSALSFIHSFID